MFFKSLVLGAVCALMAGGAIYYTTLPSTAPALDGYPNQDRAIPRLQNQQYGSVATNNTGSLPQNEMSQNTLEPQENPIVQTPRGSQNEAQNSEQRAQNNSSQETSTPYVYEAIKQPSAPKSGLRQWIDQYLTRKPAAQNQDNIRQGRVDQSGINQGGLNQGELNQRRPSQDVIINEGELAGSNPQITDQNAYAETNRQATTYTYEGDTTQIPPNRQGQNQIAAPQNTAPQQRQIQNVPMGLTADIDFNIQTAMREIAKISAPTISEQAYFSLVNYALSHARFSDAQTAMNQIGTVEMRETARINMAVALARNGQSQRAFDMVESIEAPEYRDILRLQVVEALLERKDTQERR